MRLTSLWSGLLLCCWDPSDNTGVSPLSHDLVILFSSLSHLQSRETPTLILFLRNTFINIWLSLRDCDIGCCVWKEKKEIKPSRWWQHSGFLLPWAMPTIILNQPFIFKCISEPLQSEKSFLTYELSDGWVEENMELSFKQLETILLINFCQVPRNIFHYQIPNCLKQYKLMNFYQSSLGHSETSLLRLNKSQTLINKDWHGCKSNELVCTLSERSQTYSSYN